jgi:subtilisin family serine protease
MMKHVLLIVLALQLPTLKVGAQSSAKMDFHLRSFIAQAEDPTRLVDIFIHGDKDAVTEAVKANGGSVKSALPKLVNARVPVGRIAQLALAEAVDRFEFSMERGELLNDSMRVKTRVNWVHEGRAPLGQGYDGTGVVVGFIDSGLDLLHPDLRTADDQSRVYRYWDQVPGPNSASPAPFGYGTEWTQEELNSGGALPVEPPALYGHGTTVAGTAVGNGLANGRHKGVAAEADIIIVATNFSAPNWKSTVADGVAYIIQEAEAAGKPAVINASLGTYLGSHDGNDAAALFIEQLIQEQGGRVMVAAAGNSNALDPYHMQTEVTSDTTWTWFRYNPNSGLGFGAVFFEVWADAEDFDNVDFAIGADRQSPSFRYRGNTPYRTIDQLIGETVTDTLFSLSGHRLGVVEYYAAERGGQYQLQVLMAMPDTVTYLYRFMTTGVGKFDVWSTGQYGTSSMVNIAPQVGVVPGAEHYVLPDRNKHMVDSWACLSNVITVANYCNEVSYVDYAGNMQTVPGTEEDISPASSAGPTRDERMKPDIAATGDITFTAAPLDAIQAIIDTQNGWKVDPGGMHIRNGGTSMASPVVAGAAALYLQRCPTATAQEIIDAVHRNARMDVFTGEVPNNYWGMGKLDAFNMLLNNAELQTVATEICDGRSVEVSVPEGFSVVEWSDGSTGDLLLVAEAGEISASLVSAAGCPVFSDTLAFAVIPSPEVPVIVMEGSILTSSVGPSYQWYLDGELLVGENGQAIEATISGTYTVEFVGLNGCTAISEGVDVIILGLTEGTMQSLKVWPIPAQDQLFVRIPQDRTGPVTLTIISSDGKVVLRQGFERGAMITVPLGGLAAGTYTVQAELGQKSWSKRFVKLP